MAELIFKEAVKSDNTLDILLVFFFYFVVEYILPIEEECKWIVKNKKGFLFLFFLFVLFVPNSNIFCTLWINIKIIYKGIIFNFLLKFGNSSEKKKIQFFQFHFYSESIKSW